MKGKPTFQLIIRATLVDADDGFSTIIVTNPIKQDTPRFEDEIYNGLINNRMELNIPLIKITDDTYNAEINFAIDGGEYRTEIFPIDFLLLIIKIGT